MLDSVGMRVVRALVASAQANTRTTYEKLAAEIGWSHPTGRGLGKVLYSVMHECNSLGLPPITLIVVRKGTRFPSPDAMPHITSALGNVDVASLQNDVFTYDWDSVAEFRSAPSLLPGDDSIWLTSFWGFDPSKWGCIGFSTKGRRNYFLRRTHPGVVVCIYVTKGRGRDDERGKIVGFLEVSHVEGPASDFIDGEMWAAKEAKPEERGKWMFALKVTRAWRVAPEDVVEVDRLLQKTYKKAHPEFIGSQGVEVVPDEASRLRQLTVYEVPVYDQRTTINPAPMALRLALKSSGAVTPASAPYWVGEPDSPKHLYILKLTGDLVTYLGRSASELDDRMIIKVGFSKSPMTRRDQIQSAYPAGSFKWEILYPKTLPALAPYPNAGVAIAGEDMMKRRLQEDGGETLGKEFYLADPGLVYRTWIAGTLEAERKMKDLIDVEVPLK